MSGGVTQLTANNNITVSASTGAVAIGVAENYSIPSNVKQEEWDNKVTAEVEGDTLKLY